MQDFIINMMCPLGIATITCALPLILNVISRIDEKYSSNSLFSRFKGETVCFVFWLTSILWLIFVFLKYLFFYLSCKCIDDLLTFFLVIFSFSMIIEIICISRLAIEYLSPSELIEKLKNQEDSYFSLSEIYQSCLIKNDCLNCENILEHFLTKSCNVSTKEISAVLSQLSTCLAATYEKRNFKLLLRYNEIHLNKFFNDNQKEQKNFIYVIGGFLFAKQEFIFLESFIKNGLKQTDSDCYKTSTLRDAYKNKIESFPYFFDGDDYLQQEHIQDFILCVLLFSPELRNDKLLQNDFNEKHQYLNKLFKIENNA